MSGYPWSAGCDESRTIGVEGGRRNGPGNPGVALPPDPTSWVPRTDPRSLHRSRGAPDARSWCTCPGNNRAEELRDGLIKATAPLPAALRKSLTWDQESEMAKHAEFTAVTWVPVYFCDPHSPWQRGTNENTNGLLRQYFPKEPT